MYALADWGMQCGEDVVKLCEVMEQKSKLAPTSFKILEQFRDPADYNKLLGAMLGSTSPNVSHLKSLAKGILQRRNWIWVLMHPELDTDHIHPDRSVFPQPASICFRNGVHWFGCIQGDVIAKGCPPSPGCVYFCSQRDCRRCRDWRQHWRRRTTSGCCPGSGGGRRGALAQGGDGAGNQVLERRHVQAHQGNAAASGGQP